jgi:sodium-independent sulfate anion transporter 11
MHSCSGFIANFISAPVISGFTSGVALTIVATQLKSLLGLHFDKEGFLPTMIGVFEHIREVHKWDTILSIIGLSTYMFLKVITCNKAHNYNAKCNM